MLVSMMLIRTPRFVLRDLVETDRAEFTAYQMDPRYRRLYGYDDADDKRPHELFDLFIGWQQDRPRQNFQIGIFDSATGRLCGCAGLRASEQPKGTAVLGIELAPRDWGRYRMAVEVASALIEHGFHTLGLSAIVGDTSSGNTRVEKLARWFGASMVARRDGADWMTARGWQEVDWALSRDDWANSQRRHASRRGR